MTEEASNKERRAFANSLARKLDALGYPYAHTKSYEKDEDFAEIVWFLENRVVRNLEPAERGSLRSFQSGYREGIFRKYLQDLDCPSHVLNNSNVNIRLQWLVRHAISISYEEMSKECDRALLSEGNRCHGAGYGATKPDNSASFEMASGASSPLELGFSTNSRGSNCGAKVLRMLYVEDLRTLQNEVNALLVSIQEFTADPRTDSKLGKVGY